MSDPDATLQFLRQTYGRNAAPRAIFAGASMTAGVAWLCLTERSIDGHELRIT